MSKKGKQLRTAVDLKLVDKFKKMDRESESIEDFVYDFLGQFISEQTKRAYLRDMFDFFDFLKRGGAFISSPKDISGGHFQLYRDELIEKNRTSATINRKLVAIRSFIKWSLAKRLINVNPLDIVKLPKVDTSKPTEALDDDEVQLMIEAVKVTSAQTATHKLVLQLLFSLGIRRSELLNIKVKDIYQKRNHTVVEINGKGNKKRLLPLSESVIYYLQVYSQVMKSFGVEFDDNDYLISGKSGKKIDGSTIYRIVKRYALKAGIQKDISPHSCRATAISHLLDTHKVPIRDVAIFAGHSKVTTTQRYDKRTKDLDNSAAYSIDYKLAL